MRADSVADLLFSGLQQPRESLKGRLIVPGYNPGVGLTKRTFPSAEMRELLRTKTTTCAFCHVLQSADSGRRLDDAQPIRLPSWRSVRKCAS